MFSIWLNSIQKDFGRGVDGSINEVNIDKSVSENGFKSISRDVYNNSY